MRRAAAAAAASFLLWAPAASARDATGANLPLRGISHALAQHWLKPDDAARYRRDVNRANHALYLRKMQRIETLRQAKNQKLNLTFHCRPPHWEGAS